MAEQVVVRYDREADILEIFVAQPREALSEEIGDDVFVRIDPETRKVVGFSILHFTHKVSLQIPIEADLSLAPEIAGKLPV